MEKEEKSPQSQRLDAFRKSTGYSITEFGHQCEIKSPSTLHKIISEGISPSPKVLDKVIKRFPMLNHDWVVLGYGEMIVKGLQTQEINANSLSKSTDSAYQYIIEALRDHDFALNTLSKNVEKAMANSVHETEVLKIKVDEMLSTMKVGTEFIIEKEAKRDAFFEKMHANEMVKIKALDKERRENREKGQKILSERIYQYLKESRESIFSALNNAKEDAIMQSQENINKQFGEHTINKKP